MNGLKLLEQAIREHPHLKLEDHRVVTDVCSKLHLSDDLGMINESFRWQVELEAAAVYLKSRYGSIVNRLESSLTEYQSGKFVEMGPRDEEGLKWTAKAKEQWILATDPHYAAKLDVFKESARLLDLIKGLSDIVFGRDRKLEQLSINYRREVQADTRSSG